MSRVTFSKSVKTCEIHLHKELFNETSSYPKAIPVSLEFIAFDNQDNVN